MQASQQQHITSGGSGNGCRSVPPLLAAHWPIARCLMLGPSVISGTEKLAARPPVQYGWAGSSPEELDNEQAEVFQEAYAADPTWAAKGPALLQQPRLAGGRLVVELTSLKEAPKASRQSAARQCMLLCPASMLWLLLLQMHGS